MARLSPPNLAPLSHWAFSALILASGAALGVVFMWLGTPLPFMLGSLISSAVIAMRWGPSFPMGYEFPPRIRQVFVGVIGVMIGAQVSPELLALLPKMAVSIPAVIAFVVLAHGGNYLIFRRLGGLDKHTAFYSGTPGGLLESIAFGEEDGADIRVLTIMQFLRIIVVVMILPVAISIYEGAPVGSAAGLSTSTQAAQAMDIVLTFVFALIGLWIGTAIRVPAAQLTGPLLVVGIASAFGLIDLVIPGWLVGSAQVVLGAGLGLRFVGLTRRMLVQGVGLATLSGGFMLALGGAISYALAVSVDLDLEMLIISFAPGGVTEMSLIALSLAANPAFVTLHHLVRILAAVGELALVKRMGWLNRS
ncbi:MAG TPA: aminopeptidase [Maritimibacter sp.]|nr:aminopeptidase [Maritimibacter sp.]